MKVTVLFYPKRHTDCKRSATQVPVIVGFSWVGV